jgi:dissimilatory sulfite reductase (desulfoviridin) alpha/beta subunit
MITKRKDVRQLIIDAAEKFGTNTAFIENDKQIDFLTLKEDVFKLANSLQEMGFKKGRQNGNIFA